MLTINLFGGPGTGKSTLACDVFAKFKYNNINCELVREYAKDKVWEGATITLDDQLYVFAKQYHKQFILKDKVDVVITDSPLLLSLIYGTNHTQLFDQLVIERFKEYNNLNIFIKRIKPYHKVGRLQTEKDAIEIDNLIMDTLKNNNIQFMILEGDRITADIIIDKYYTDYIKGDNNDND